MSLPSFPAAAVELLSQLNGDIWDASANPFGMDDGGHIPNWPLAMNDMAEVTNYNAALAAVLVAIAQQVAEDAAAAEEGSGTEASVAAIRAVSDLAHYVSMRRVAAAMVPAAISFAAPLAWDMATGINFTATLTANTTVPNPTNQTPGKSGFIDFVQDGTGGRTITSWGGNFRWFGFLPPWPAAAGAITKVAYFVKAAGEVHLAFAGNAT